jgi:Tfp pilus assembly protein PilF
MNFKIYIIFPLFFLLVIFIVSSCGKKRNEKLGQTYYKLALLELTTQEQSQSTPDHTYRQALLNAEKALSEDERPEYLALKGTILFKLNHIRESLMYFKKALAINPDPVVKAEILNNYACILAQTGKTKKALFIWKNLERNNHYLTPEVAIFNQGKVYANKQDYNHAKSLFLNAIYIAPQYLDAHYSLALAAFACGDLKLAKNELKTVLYLEPSHFQAKKLAKTLGL